MHLDGQTRSRHASDDRIPTASRKAIIPMGLQPFLHSFTARGVDNYAPFISAIDSCLLCGGSSILSSEEFLEIHV
jgi:hypothetical protein